MWYAALPTLTIITACLYLPSLAVYVTNRLFLGTPHKRNVTTMDEAYMYLRDMRIGGGSPYNQKRLECITETEQIEEEVKEEKKPC